MNNTVRGKRGIGLAYVMLMFAILFLALTSLADARVRGENSAREAKPKVLFSRVLNNLNSSTGGEGQTSGNNGGAEGGNGGNGGNSAPGGLVTAGNVVTNATAVNVLNTVLVRITLR